MAVDPKSHAEIGELKAKCLILESRVAALSAFACAVLQSNPQRDIIQTQWAKHLGPALDKIGPGLGDNPTKFAASVPAWVQYQLEQIADKY